MLLTDGVMGWRSSQQTHCANILTGDVASIITTQALSGCHNSHYTTEKVRHLHSGNWILYAVKCFIASSCVCVGGVGVGGGVGWGCHIHTITLTSKVLLLAVYYSNRSSLNAARYNLHLLNKRWVMQNGMCLCFQWPRASLLPFTYECHQLQLQSDYAGTVMEYVWTLSTITYTHKEGTHSIE